MDKGADCAGDDTEALYGVAVGVGLCGAKDGEKSGCEGVDTDAASLANG